MADPTAPGETSFTIYQGQTWRAMFECWQDAAQTIPFDLTGCEVDMDVREGVVDAGSDILFSATTRATGEGAGRITYASRQSSGEADIDGGAEPSDGAFVVLFAASVTAGVVPAKAPRGTGRKQSELYADFEVTHPDGTVTRILSAVITFDYEVTRRS